MKTIAEEIEQAIDFGKYNIKFKIETNTSFLIVRDMVVEELQKKGYTVKTTIYSDKIEISWEDAR